MGKKVAVIGAGQSGLVALKTLQQSGHSAVCFESLSEIGGLWNYDLHTNKQGETEGYVNHPSANDQPIQSSYKSLQFITLSHTNMFSDFVPDEMNINEVSQYMSPREYLEYLKNYAEFYNLYKYINFNCHVIQVKKQSSTSFGWMISYNRKENLYEEWFDFVFVALSDKFPHIPKVLNINKFNGLAIHSAQVRNVQALFPGKSVLVVGGKFSGSDMIVNAIRHNAKKIYWSVNKQNEEKNQWCIDRFVPSLKKMKQKQPWQAFITRYENAINGTTAMRMLTNLFVPIRQKHVDEKPKHGDLLAVNDSAFFIKAIENKQIIFVPTVSTISENGENIYFGDKSSVSDVDLIVFSTGFTRRLPFLDKIWSIEQQCSRLYKLAICPKRELDGIAFIGNAQGPMAISLVAEMQCKWLCNTMLLKNYNKDGTLYSVHERTQMETNILQQLGDDKKDYKSINEPFEYLDSLSSEIGCKVPSFNDLLKRKEIELAVALYFGPLTGAQYQVFDQKDPCFAKAKTYLINVAKVILQDEFLHLVEKYSKLSSDCAH